MLRRRRWHEECTEKEGGCEVVRGQSCGGRKGRGGLRWFRALNGKRGGSLEWKEENGVVVLAAAIVVAGLAYIGRVLIVGEVLREWWRVANVFAGGLLR